MKQLFSSASTRRHPRPHTLALAAAALGALHGCAIVGSRAPDAATPPSGMLYHLPKAVLPVELVDADGALELRLLAAKQVADPAQRYLLQHPINALSSDNVKVEFDAQGLLLSKLTLDSTDQTLAALTQLAKAGAIGRAEAATAGEVVLASGDFDPDPGADNARLFSDLHEAMARHVGRWERQCQAKPNEAPERCSLVARLVPRLGTAGLLQISATPLGAVVKGDGAANAAMPPPPDCSLGVCYRSQRPYQLRLAVDGEFSRSTVLMLSNGAPAIALPLERAAFVKTEHTVEFNGNGSIKSVDSKRPSSALALVSWPMDVYKAFMQSTGELIKLRIDYNSDAQKLAQNELDTAKEMKRIADEMETLRNAKDKKEASGSSSNALLSISMGERNKSAGSLLIENPQAPAGPTPGQPSAGAGSNGGK